MKYKSTVSSIRGKTFLLLVACVALVTSSCSFIGGPFAMIEFALPVYNAIFSPTAPETRATLYDKEPAHVQFFIGSPAPANAIPKEKWTVNQAILNQPGVFPLVVTMSCLACRHDSVQKRVITYDSSHVSSDVADFEFVPDKELAQEKDGLAQVIFDVSSRGIQYDHIVVNTFIVGKEHAGGKRLEPQPFIPFASFSLQESSKEPDLVLTLFRDPDQTLTVHFQPVATWLESKFQRKHLNANGEPKAFSAGSLSETDFGKLASEYYLQLKALVEPNNDALQSALSNTYKNDVRLVSYSEMQLPSSAQDKILEKMYQLGAELYIRIFGFEKPGIRLTELKEMLDIIENIESPAPLKIRVETNTVHLPWQLLHKPVGKGPHKDFWGLKYELSVTPLLSGIRGGSPGGSYTKNADILFAAYLGDQQNKDDVALLAQEQGKLLASQFGDAHVALTTSSKDFHDKLVEKRRTVEFLLAYTHASSGTVFLQQEKDGLVPLRDATGSRIIFKENDFFRSADLIKLLIDDPPDDWIEPYLRSMPIVFLNACETGTGGVSPMTRLDFPGGFIDLGASGVIVTEAPVWKWFAYFFGNDIIEALAKGQEVSKALLDARKKYMKLGNPLGLLYSYYGNPNAQIRTASR